MRVPISQSDPGERPSVSFPLGSQYWRCSFTQGAADSQKNFNKESGVPDQESYHDGLCNNKANPANFDSCWQESLAENYTNQCHEVPQAAAAPCGLTRLQCSLHAVPAVATVHMPFVIMMCTSRCAVMLTCNQDPSCCCREGPC